MNKKEIHLEIEKVLDEWDPIGILEDLKPISYAEGGIGEYSNYVKPIIEIYLSKHSLYEYLVNLNSDLMDYPNDEMKKSITIVAEKITDLLSNNNEADFL